MISPIFRFHSSCCAFRSTALKRTDCRRSTVAFCGYSTYGPVLPLTRPSSRSFFRSSVNSITREPLGLSSLFTVVQAWSGPRTSTPPSAAAGWPAAGSALPESRAPAVPGDQGLSGGQQVSFAGPDAPLTTKPAPPGAAIDHTCVRVGSRNGLGANSTVRAPSGVAMTPPSCPITAFAADTSFSSLGGSAPDEADSRPAIAATARRRRGLMGRRE